MRRSRLPEGHVCQSQETGAEVGGSFSAKVRLFFPCVCVCLEDMLSPVKEISAWTGQTFLWRWCQQLLAVRQLKSLSMSGWRAID